MVSHKKTRWAAIFVLVALFLQMTSPVHAKNPQTALLERQVTAELTTIRPVSVQMIDETVAVLDQGWQGMSAGQQALFLRYFDPAGTGEVDEAFVTAVRANYLRIRRSFTREVPLWYESHSYLCQDMRLYYTDLLTLHVCPYFLTEANDLRKARTLIHEYAHIALLVVDRPYYRPHSQAYARLTPRGSRPAQLPLIGPLIREISANDTLHHPDAYAHYALAASGKLAEYIELRKLERVRAAYTEDG